MGRMGKGVGGQGWLVAGVVGGQWCAVRGVRTGIRPRTRALSGAPTTDRP